MAASASPDYAGEISAAEAWKALGDDPKAQLIDVRTMAEWSFVGVPDLASVSRRVHCVEWQKFPSMELNPGFVREAETALAGADRDAPVLLMCRSGARSRAAAIALAAAGFTRAYNISDGFEGGLDQDRHRGLANGWKAAGLPWKQS